MKSNNSFNRQETLINIADNVISQFFETRYKLVLNMKDLYIQGCLDNTEELLIRLKLTEADMKDLIEEIQNKQCKEISCNLYKQYPDIGKITDSLSNASMKEMYMTENIAKVCTKLMNQSIYMMIDHIFKGNLLGNLFQQCNYADKLLNQYNLSKLQQRHNEFIQEQLIGLLINFKTDFRNKLIQTVLLENNSFYTDYDATCAA